ncbi:hypothetical protein [Pseudonocardia phyllosphaerae]|uniref:hypothetical protein n=1 Tax=Pseudonocardia phyllosphaerae TaxID=3390502 RepID=UPI00397B7AA5
MPVLLAGAALLVLRPELFPTSTRTVVPASAPVVPASAPVSTPATVPTATAPVPQSAESELADAAAGDRTRVAATVGYWVPQLSSKKPGTTDGGVTYGSEAIFRQYQAFAAQYPGAALLWSGDWPVFKNDDYWVVVVAQPYSTAAEANAWCSAQGFGADDCFAKKLSNTEGPQGTTVHR